MTQQVVYGFILKMKQLILINLNTADTDAFKFFKYKDRLIRNIVAQPTSNEANKILETATSAVQIKYLKYFLEIAPNVIN